MSRAHRISGSYIVISHSDLLATVVLCGYVATYAYALQRRDR